MKLTIERADFLKALGHVQNIVERKQPVAMLSNALLDVQDGTLRLTTTDTDMAVVERVAVSTGDNGALTAPAHMLHDIVRKLPDGAQVSLDVKEGDDARVTLRSARSRFTLQTLPAEGFSAIAEGELPCGFTLPVADARRLIDQTRFAMSRDDSRYYLNGIFLHTPQPEAGAAPVLRAVATDGHRLARVDAPCPEGAAAIPQNGVIIPRKAILEVYRLLEGVDEDVRFELSENKIRFSFGGVVMTSKLVDGAFPDYQRVIPTGNDKVVTLETRPFSDAVDRVATIISSDGVRALKMVFSPDSVVLSTSDRDGGTAEEELSIGYEGLPIEIGFNANYLLETIAQAKSGQAEMLIADSTSPVIVRDREDGQGLYVLMPMRV